MNRTEANPLVCGPEETEELFKSVYEPKNPEDAQTLEPFYQEPEYGVPKGEAEGEIQQTLTDDAYSLLYVADFWSKTTIFATAIIILQGGMLIVTFLDLVDLTSNPNKTNDEVNRMRIPAGAELTVTLAQCFGMILTVMVMSAEGDLVTGLTRLLEGYDAEIRYAMPNATCFRWLATAMLQSIMGFILLLDSFILSMQSTTVIDLVLNLTALHFLQEIDEMFFNLASMGVLVDAVQEDCERVQSLKQVAPPEFTRRVKFCKRVLTVLLAVGLLVPYAFVVSWQVNGRFLCKKVYLQFGDAYYPQWAHYSGEFKMMTSTLDARASYIDESNTLQLAFCRSEHAWTISEFLDGTGSTCEYIFKSDDTNTFDVIEVADEGWKVKTDDTGDVPVDWLKLTCNDCNEERCKAKYGSCNVTENQCECHDEQGGLGLNCELDDTCGFFNIDFRTRDSLASIPGASIFFKNEFSAWSFPLSFLEGDAPLSFPEENDYTGNNTASNTDFVAPTLYERYIYVPLHSIAHNHPISSFIVFTGRRWVVYSTPQDTLPTLTSESFARYLSNNVMESSVETLINMTTHFLTLYNLSPLFFSTPVDYGSESYGGTPSRVGWVFATKEPNSTVFRPDDEHPASARLLCSDCTGEDDSFCQNGGYCNDAGYCLCQNFYQGYQCEKAFDCVQAGCYNGTCIPDTKICECNEGYYGNLCQYGENGEKKLEDKYLCSRCAREGSGECDSIFDSECKCTEGISGKYCNISDTLPSNGLDVPMNISANPANVVESETTSSLSNATESGPENIATNYGTAEAGVPVNGTESETTISLSNATESGPEIIATNNGTAKTDVNSTVQRGT